MRMLGLEGSYKGEWSCPSGEVRKKEWACQCLGQVAKLPKESLELEKLGQSSVCILFLLPTLLPSLSLSPGREGGSSGAMAVGEGFLEEVTSEVKFNWTSASPLEGHLFLSAFRVFCGSVTLRSP